MSVKPPTEQQNSERDLLPFEKAKLRELIRKDERRQWVWKQTRTFTGFGVAGFTLFLLIKDTLGGS